jgi:hypothetical protein
MSRSIVAALVCLCVTSLASAAKVKVWQHHAPSNYEKAQFKQTVISNEGALRLARSLKPLADLDATHIWDVIEDAKGNLFVATGDDGKIYKVTPEGKVSTVYSGDDSQVFCLAKSAQGTIYAGTGPGGRIIEINSAGNAKVFCETGETYVWSLAVASDNSIYAGTGPHGRVLHVSTQGKASVFYTSRQEHVLCIGLGEEGSVYAGTDKSGLVYRIDSKGKGFVLFSAPQGEIRTLHVTADAVYVGTSSPTSRRSGGTATSSAGSGGSSVASAGSGSPDTAADKKEQSTPTAGPSGKPAKVSEGSGTSSESHESGKGSSASPPSPPSSGENSLYRIGKDGSVRELFREKAMVLSQLEQGGRILIGTGMQGQLFEIDESNKEKSEIARLDHGQILCLLRRHDGSVLVGASDPGKLYVLQDRYVAKGTVVSEVMDAKLASKWGSMSWRADAPAGTKISVAVRTGNVAEPDDTWSDWSNEQTDPQSASVTAPAARYLQYRITLESDKEKVTPVMHSISIRYATTNQAPEITSLEVPDLDSGNLDNPKKLKFKWNAVDPNEDELAFNLYVRKDGWKHWVRIEEGLDHKDYEWDTTAMPSGTYELKVLASDRRDNSPEETLTAERISAPFVVSNTPPTVTVKVVGMDGDQAVLEATATDPYVRLSSAAFSINGKRWVPIQPAEGIFDKKTEKFRFKTEALKGGTYVVVFRVRDAAANTGSGDVVFTVDEHK